MGNHGTIDDMAKTISVMISFVGNRDPYPENDDYPGPILSFLLQHPADKTYLLCSSSEYLERAQDLANEAKNEGILTQFEPINFCVSDVIDYGAIWDQLLSTLQAIKQQVNQTLPARFQVSWLFLLDSGTPQMKSSLFLAAASGLFPASLYQGIPPSYAGGAYKYRQVNLERFALLCNPPVTRTTGTAEQGVLPVSTTALFLNSNSPLFKDALGKALRVARYDEPVLLLGETGTGKTMVARYIHKSSNRRAEPFVEVNCSAIARELAESELFGHVQGAFTGANKNRSGKFRAANRGTLFLDEIGDLPLDLQVKLLKALEDRVIYPVGSDESVQVDVRLIAATHQDLEKMVLNGSFRRDLYQRLKVVVIKLPPLRERQMDILPLAEYFITERNQKYGEQHFLSEEVQALFTRYHWLGNIRELKNTIDSACCISQKEGIDIDVLPEELQDLNGRNASVSVLADGTAAAGGLESSGRFTLPPEGIDLRARLMQVEWSYVAEALRKTGGNREASAKLLGMTGHAFRKALRERLAGFLENEWEEDF